MASRNGACFASHLVLSQVSLASRRLLRLTPSLEPSASHGGRFHREELGANYDVTDDIPEGISAIDRPTRFVFWAASVNVLLGSCFSRVHTEWHAKTGREGIFSQPPNSHTASC